MNFRARNRFTFTCLLVVLLLGPMACSSPKTDEVFIPAGDPSELIAGAGEKTWKLARRYNGKTRMNMGDCFLSYRQTYRADGTMQDNAGDYADCGKTLKGSWNVTRDEKGHHYIQWQSPMLKELMHTDKDSKLFRIQYLDENEMVLYYRHQQFSDKARYITDIYVPEGLDVKGRDFHW